jgi:nucleoside permease NupC
LALIEMVDQLLIYLGNRVDIALSFNDICSVIFYPVAWLMGVDGDDCKEVAILLGIKICEYIVYVDSSLRRY